MSDFGNEGSFVILWAGENPSVHVNLIEKLEANGIAFNDISWATTKLRLPRILCPSTGSRALDLKLPCCLRTIPAAKELLDNLLEREPENLEIPAQPEVVDPSTMTPKANEAPATLQVWKGTDTKLAQFLTSALSENNLVARVANEAGSTAIYVAEGNQARALEIVREVTQGAPPK